MLLYRRCLVLMCSPQICCAFCLVLISDDSTHSVNKLGCLLWHATNKYVLFGPLIIKGNMCLKVNVMQVFSLLHVT